MEDGDGDGDLMIEMMWDGFEGRDDDGKDRINGVLSFLAA